MATSNIDIHNSETSSKSTKIISEDRHKGAGKIRQGYKFIYWLTQKGILRIFRWFPDLWYDYHGILLGKLLLRKEKKKLISVLTQFYPNMNIKKRAWLADGYIRYMGALVLDMGLNIPNLLIPKNSIHRTKFRKIQYENLERLDELYAQGKGILMPTLHTGQWLHPLGGIFGLPTIDDPSQLIKLATISEPENRKMYLPIIDKYRNYKVSITQPFSNLKDILIRQLQENYVLLIYYDYASRDGFRLPFSDPPHNFLRSVPFSIAKLHRMTGSPILPVLVSPKGQVPVSKMQFLDNSLIMETSKKYWNEPEDVFIQQLSLAINRTLHPHIFTMPHAWEQLLTFSKYVFGLKIQFPKRITLVEFLDINKIKMLDLIKNSYEPNRNNEKLISHIHSAFNHAQSQLKHALMIFSNKITHFRYFDRSGGIMELKNIAKMIRFQLTKRNETKAANSIFELIKNLG